MKAIYFKAGPAEWCYTLEDEEFEEIVNAVLDEEAEMEEMFADSLEVLRDHSATSEEELEEEDLADEAVSVAVVWHYFNTLPLEQGGIRGDVALIEHAGGEGVTAFPAAEVIDEPPRRN